MKKIIITILLSSLTIALKGQKGKIGIGITSPETVLHVVSNKNGILIPRQTANQIQNIMNPHESELVYCLLDNGTMVNKKGFWFYNFGVWRPLAENTSAGSNIYTIDNSLTMDRQLALDGHTLSFGPGLLYLNDTNTLVGISTTSPTQALDINGDVRIQELNTRGNVVADAQGVLQNDANYFDIGDIKPSYAAGDHDGWYLLNGRNITTLPQVAQNNAINILGLTGSLPNATDKYSIGTTTSTATVTGTNTIVLTRANLPLFNFSYSTNSTGAHSHTVTYDRIRATTINGGGNNIHTYWLSGSIVGGGSGYTRNTGSISHNHTYSVASGGNSSPIDIRPNSINFNYFVYLGN